ncbi:hypothetical protein BDD12DRAFT_945731 [Trichophaea hybrida]|nr:hypothetical protein BDD12DRAFT_945731 [Trichophaea hybrida]
MSRQPTPRCIWWAYGCGKIFSTKINAIELQASAQAIADTYVQLIDFEEQTQLKDHLEVCRSKPVDLKTIPLVEELVTHDSTVLKYLGKSRLVEHRKKADCQLDTTPFTFSTSSLWSKSGKPSLSTVKTHLKQDACGMVHEKTFDKMFDQLADPMHCNPADTVSLLEVESTETWLANAPQWLKREQTWPKATAGRASKWSVTPKGTFTDVHVDRGFLAVVVPERGRKIWILWKPERPFYDKQRKRNEIVRKRQEKRRVAFYSATNVKINGNLDNSHQSIFQTQAKTFQHPFITATGGDENIGLFVPEGWRHCVFTVRSGILGGWIVANVLHLSYAIETLLFELKRHVETCSKSSTVGYTCIIMNDIGNSLDAICSALAQASSAGRMKVVAVLRDELKIQHWWGTDVELRGSVLAVFPELAATLTGGDFKPGGDSKTSGDSKTGGDS